MYQFVQLVGTQTAQCAMRIAECIAVMRTTIYPNPKWNHLQEKDENFLWKELKRQWAVVPVQVQVAQGACGHLCSIFFIIPTQNPSTIWGTNNLKHFLMKPILHSDTLSCESTSADKEKGRVVLGNSFCLTLGEMMALIIRDQQTKNPP